jgi:two-component system CheB/CheR fusion protein
VGIGASAGGLEAFIELLRALPADTGMAFVVIQHLDPHQDSVLADLLASRTAMTVSQVHGDTRVEANQVYVIPPNRTMVLEKSTLCLSARPASEFHKPIDTFLISLANQRGSNSIGVILSGTASDGTLGLKAIKSAGGVTFCQDLSAKFDSMPRNAIAAGVVDFVLPPRRIAAELALIAQHPYYVRGDQFTLSQDGPTLHKILSLLRSRTSVDFTQYKQPTIQRRLVRRMALRRTDSLDDYYAILKGEPIELEGLFEDLLINVTEYFRDPGVFASLKENVFPALLKDRREGESIRIWVPGCSTGEEIYSLAISLFEYFVDKGLDFPLQIFGTDVSDRVIDKARAGLYSESALAGVSAERRRRFFSRSDAGYQISRTVREMCVFSRHNVARDPALSRMDLISCRNLLIYLTPALQKRVISTFGYALQPSGYLLLGSSETLGAMADYFTPVDAERPIFRRKPNIPHTAFSLGNTFAPGPAEAASGAPGVLSAPRSAQPRDSLFGVERFVDRMLLAQYAPSGMVIDSQLKTVEFRGNAEKYLADNTKRPGADVFSVVLESLQPDLRRALTEATRTGIPHRVAGSSVSLEVTPLRLPDAPIHYLITFTDSEDGNLPGVAQPADPDQRIAQLERELNSTRQYLQAIIEELRTTNEEAQSANEELQSTNEELQTAKEELQSSNEELNTINAEMLSSNGQLALLNDDLTNLLSSMNMPIVMLSRDLRIRRFTPLAESVLHLIPADVGRPITDIQLRIGVPNFEQVLQGVLDTLAPWEQEVRDQEGRWYILRIRPYRTGDHRIEGALIQLLDVGEILRKLEEVRNARDYSEAIVDTLREPLVVLDRSLLIQNVNRSFLHHFRLNRNEVEGKRLSELGKGALNSPRLKVSLTGLVETGAVFRDLELEEDEGYEGRRVLSVNGGLIESVLDGRLLLVAFQDVTERKQAAEARYRRLFESARDGIIIVDADTGAIADVNPFVEHLTGYCRRDLVGRKFWESPVLRHLAQGAEELNRIREQEVARYPEVAIETRNGQTLLSELVANIYSEGDRRVIQFNMRDLTDRRKFEREVQQSARLESLGLLAGGIAHDFNNLLTGVLGNASLAYTSTPPGHGNRRLLREIHHSAERAALLTRQMLAYAGKGRRSVERIVLPGFIRDVVPLVQTSIPKMVNVNLSFDPSTPEIDGDPGQIQQLLMNLIINAAEAIGEAQPGRIDIVTGERELTAANVAESYSKDEIVPGCYAIVEVIDNGIGMDEATKARIFDPFFTTKFTGRGLGLAASLGIVKSHGGAIHVFSAPGKGSSFQVLIPEAREARPIRPMRVTKKRPGGEGTILLIDDEQVVRDVTRLILQRAGFRVLAAENGQKGVELFAEHAREVKLVLLDLLMPVMGGDEAFDQIRKIRPNVPVILVSGFEEEEAFRRFGDNQLQGFIKKPFTADWLCESVREAMQK